MVSRNVKEKVTGNTGGEKLEARICFATVADTAGSRDVLVGKRHQDIHVIDGEEAGVAVQHPLIPVFIDLIGQGDDVAFLEA